MKQKYLTMLLSVLMSMVGTKTFAYDIEVKNADGVTIYYNLINDGTELAVTSPNDYSMYYKGNVVIPESVTYKDETRNVTSIGDNAFKDCTGLTKLTIPNSVTYIGNQAFYDCSGLTELTIPNSVTSIGIYAFHGCSGLTELTLSDGESVLAIPGQMHGSLNTVSGCPIEKLHLGRNISYYDYSPFRGLTSLKTLTIGNSVTSIGDNAFKDCSGLTELTIPNSVTSIGNYTFSGCSGLTELTIPNSVTSIGDYAFKDCTGLTELTIPNSVTSIGEGAFESCI